MFGNRAIYSDGWVAATRHSIPWLLSETTPLKDDVWELYKVDDDFSEANNLAAQNPEKLKELQTLFMKEAERNYALPIDDRRSERFDAQIAGRPDLMGPRTKLSVFPGMNGIPENAFINIKNRSYTITANVVLPNGNANGVLIAQAGSFGGWVLYFKNGKIHHEYNFFGLERTNIGSAKTVSPGNHVISFEFINDGGKPGSGGKTILMVDGQKVAEGYVPKTQPFAFSADEGTDVGMDNETAVSKDYKKDDNKFTGKIIKITIETKPPNLTAEAGKTIIDGQLSAQRAED